MSFIMSTGGADGAPGRKDVPDTIINASIYREAKDANLSVPHYINRMFPDADPKYGSAFKQICASEGCTIVSENQFGLVSPSVADILDGKSSIAAGPANTSRQGSPIGNQSQVLFPAAFVAAMEDVIQPDRVEDSNVFRRMVANTVPIAGDTYIQPILSYANAGGANTGANRARAGRVSELANPPMILQLTTSDRVRNIPTYGYGIEMSDKALRATTLDVLALTTGRFIQIEKDERVYQYLSNIWSGDLDHNTGAVSAVTTTSLDSAATGGVVTHRAWLKFLARKRKKRQIKYLISDLDSYLAVEGRTGRPGSNNYDPTLARIDPQARIINDTFGGDVEWFIVDSAADGGPVPANTIWALDPRYGIQLVTNTEASYTAAEDFVLRRSKVMVVNWAEEAMRMFGNDDLTPFDVLTIL